MIILILQKQYNILFQKIQVFLQFFHINILFYNVKTDVEQTSVFYNKNILREIKGGFVILMLFILYTIKYSFTIN